MDISEIASSYSDYLSSSSSATEKINSINSTNYDTASADELMSSCKEFEEYLIEMVMKEMTKSVDIFGNIGEVDSATSTTQDMAKDQLIQTLATEISDSGDLGIAQKLYESMKRNA